LSDDVATINKNGRMLNLLETHVLLLLFLLLLLLLLLLLCDLDHRIMHCHDPVADVILTKCIFNYIVSRIKPIVIYRLYKKYKKNKKDKN